MTKATLLPSVSPASWPVGTVASVLLAAQTLISLVSAVFYRSQTALVLVGLDVIWAVLMVCHVLLLRQGQIRYSMLAVLLASSLKAPLAVLASPDLFPVVVLLPGLAVAYVLLQPQVFRAPILIAHLGVVYISMMLAYSISQPIGDLPRSATVMLLLVGIPTGALALLQIVTRYRAQFDSTLRRTQTANESLNRTRDQLSHLLEVSRVIGAQTDLDTLLDVALVQLQDMVGFEHAAVLLVDPDMRITESRYSTDVKPLAARLNALRKLQPHQLQVVRSGDSMLVTDVFDTSTEARLVRQSLESALDASPNDALKRTQSWIGIPLNAQGKTVGLLSIGHSQRWFFRAQHAQLSLAFANQMAAAIISMRLKDQAVRAAAHNERARLSRELHDSVSQQIFGVSLGARTALELLPPGADRARQPLTYVLDLAEAALTEMRALIFELRPESLCEDGLVLALKRQAAAVIARYKAEHGTKLELSLCSEEPDLPMNVKEALYRVSLEALQNAAKHAQASKIEMLLQCDACTITIEISDNGKGFDPAGSYPGHLGLITMRERAEQVGGHLFIDSAPGRGTQIIVRAPICEA